ncbi:MAG: DUF4163 domain-containing protein [Firmicutes bacterium]|nr:DUF4163 domain-containing protein [Bacillota bacterium]
MKKIIAFAAAAVMALSAPVSGFAATSQDIITNKRIYSEAKHTSKAMSYQTAAVKLSKKSGKKEYIKVDIVYPNMKGYTSIIKDFNAQNKAEMRKMGESFIKEYAKDAQKYSADTKFASSKAEAPYSLKIEYSMKYNQNSVISVLYTKTVTIAGDVESVEYSSRNFDFVTGKEIEPDEVSVIPTKGETVKLALKNFKSKIKSGKKIYYQDVELDEDDLQFYFENKAIVFYVAPGLIADADRGIVTYKLDDDTARTYLKNKAK